MMARTADESEGDRMWPLITARFPDFGKSQAETDRQLPLVLLEPIAWPRRDVACPVP